MSIENWNNKVSEFIEPQHFELDRKKEMRISNVSHDPNLFPEEESHFPFIRSNENNLNSILAL